MTSARTQVLAAALLAGVAGCVDAISFVVLHRTFTANMTGNSTQLGIAAGRSGMLVPLVVAVGAFVGAIVVGTTGIELATRAGLRATATPALVVEALLLVAFIAIGAHVLHDHTAPDHGVGFYVLLVIAVVAMGLQTATLTTALGATIRTTYVSGLLTTFGQELVNTLMPARERAPSYLRDELGLGERKRSLERLLFHGGVWAAFVAGACWGSYGEERWSSFALVLPLLALIGAAALDLWRPVHRGSAEERSRLRRRGPRRSRSVLESRAG